jgi:hypothetical protein
MLPDYPEFKERARATVLMGVRNRIPQLAPILEGIRHSTIHEGRSSRLVRADDSTQEIDLKLGRATLEIPAEQMKSITQEQLMALITQLAQQVADYQEQTLFSTLEQVTEETGNSVSAITLGAKEAFLEAQRKVQVDFDPDTLEPKNMVFVVHPSQSEALIAAIQEWEKDPEFSRALDQIRARQLEDWRARESSRQLVD